MLNGGLGVSAKCVRRRRTAHGTIPDDIHGFWWFEREVLVRRNDIRSLPGLFECNSGDRGSLRPIENCFLIFQIE